MLIATTGAHGQSLMIGMGVQWKCVQEHDASHHVACIPIPVPIRADQAAASTMRSGMRAVPVTEGTSPPTAPVPRFMGRDMRPVMARGIDEVFSTTAWRVPLHTQPSDSEAVRRLLQVVLCGDSTECSVGYRDFRLARSP